MHEVICVLNQIASYSYFQLHTITIKKEASKLGAKFAS